MRARTFFYTLIIALWVPHLVSATDEAPALSAEMASEQELERATTSNGIAILPPVVQFLSMESNLPIEAPKAEKEEISKAIADAVKASLIDEGVLVSLVPISAFQSQNSAVSSATVYDFVRGKKNAPYSDEIIQALTGLAKDDSAPGNYLIIRARYYLDDLGRSGRGWQVATSILSADRSDKRMVVDARLHSAENLYQKWRTRVQERVTPRASEKAIERTAEAFGADIGAVLNKEGEEK